MKHLVRLFVFATLALLALTQATNAYSAAVPLAPTLPATLAQSVGLSNETPEFWFVELASPPTADGSALNTVRQEKENFRNAARAAGLRFSERFAFDTLWNGLAVKIERGQLSTLARVDGVKAIYPVENYALPPTRTLDPQLATALAMTGADVAQSELGYTGNGIRVAVMDTGVDYHHPDLGSCFGPGCRVFTGWDFVGDAFNMSDPGFPISQTPAPDPNPDDCEGHGTHVAGIVGANGAVKGVAPGVMFGAYRVFGCNGNTSADIMLAAMERVLADKMHILNMSIGSSFQWPQYPTAQASDRLVNKGIVVVASIGNAGANGLYAASAPGVGSKVIGVASFDNTHIALPYFTITADNMKIGYQPATGSPLPPTAGSFAVARTGTVASTADACTLATTPTSIAGKIALIRRGGCTFLLKASNAQARGAIGVVLYNNVPGRISVTVAGSPAVTIPVVSISDAEGVTIDGRLASGSVTMTWTNQLDSFPNATGNLIASTSSYGLAPDLSLKPDLGAPGGFIRSTYPVEKGSYTTLGGTSMASPHVAGAAALLLQAKPNTPSQIVRTILQNSADPKPRAGSPAGLDNVHRQGAGILDIDDAILATTKIEPGKLALGESQAGPQTRTLNLENKSNAAVTYNLSHEGALATGANTFTPSFSADYATVAFSAASVTVPAGGTQSVNVTITAPAALVDRGLYGGYIVFTPVGGGQAYRVPYTGFKGDYQAIVALAPTANGFPWLAKLVGTSFVKQNAGATFTFAGGDVPQIIVHLDHQVRRLRVEVFASSGKAWHRAFDEEYLARNSAATSFFAFAWDGTTKNGKQTNVVPNGTYVLKLSVLKALGDDNNPAHWETWTSPAFVISRP